MSALYDSSSKRIQLLADFGSPFWKKSTDVWVCFREIALDLLVESIQVVGNLNRICGQWNNRLVERPSYIPQITQNDLKRVTAVDDCVASGFGQLAGQPPNRINGRDNDVIEVIKLLTHRFSHMFGRCYLRQVLANPQLVLEYLIAICDGPQLQHPAQRCLFSFGIPLIFPALPSFDADERYHTYNGDDACEERLIPICKRPQIACEKTTPRIHRVPQVKGAAS
ncbi:hypothetical protein ACFPL7_22135 [Dongia soli]|uniref:Uncharacterized protein n=1 Tax=Dongia soli TaxID=600628 RepID=A0ABU5E9K9_9PROT|nr:hypothetical protein [Dongia soli]MDY0882290.1 hypothetical protein [Dongia soli]